MNRRYQNEEINIVDERFANNELYKAICSIGNQLESETGRFGLCPQECFTEVIEFLSCIFQKEGDIVSDLETIWYKKYNEYRRFDRDVDEDSIRKVLGIVFGFTALAIDSSQDSFYRYRFTEEITKLVCNHKFDGWNSTLDKIYSVPLADGWLDKHLYNKNKCIELNNIESVENRVGKVLNNIPGQNVIVQIVENQYNSGCQQFMGEMNNVQFENKQKDEADR